MGVCYAMHSVHGMRDRRAVCRTRGSDSGEADSEKGLAPVRESAEVGSSDVQSAHYRSATTSAENPTNAWNVSTTNQAPQQPGLVCPW